jgi:hypothetical protein
MDEELLNVLRRQIDAKRVVVVVGADASVSATNQNPRRFR